MRLAQTCGGLQSVYSERVCRRSTTRQNEAVDCRGRGPRDSVSVLHPRAYERRPSAWATAEEIMEAIWVAAEMRAGGAYAHSALALDTIAHTQGKKKRVFLNDRRSGTDGSRSCVFDAKHCSCLPLHS